MSVTAELYKRSIFDHLRRTLQPVVARAGVLVQTELKRMVNRSGSPSSPGTPPGKDTGTLGRSIQVDASKITSLRVRIGTNLPYGRIQEFGGVIRPKKVQRLPVPLNREAKLLQRRGSLRSANLTLIPRRGKDSLLVRKTKGGGIKPLFILKKSVTLPARPWVRPTRVRVAPRVLKLISQGVKASAASLPGRS